MFGAADKQLIVVRTTGVVQVMLLHWFSTLTSSWACSLTRHEGQDAQSVCKYQAAGC
jgi:hypothetical protein